VHNLDDEVELLLDLVRDRHLAGTAGRLAGALPVRQARAVLAVAEADVLDDAGNGEEREPRAEDDDQNIEQRHVRLPRVIEAH
jgi:hypothetical protein